MSIVKLSHPTKKIRAHISLPGSKSESNRLLILNALSGGRIKIENLSTARDTVQLAAILASQNETADVLDAGTSMRFLTAYYCALNRHQIITGTERMKERPIAPLVNALIEMGFNIRYLEKDGFPPLEVLPVNMEKVDNETFIDGSISSQFITALLLIAPFLKNGLTINFTSALTSRPYVEMTVKMLEDFGVPVTLTENSVTVQHTDFKPSVAYHVGADWSSASYWYAITFLSDEAEIFLEGLKDDWNQGDQAIADWMKRFGISTEFTETGALLKKVKNEFPTIMKMNFKDNPDLAQTFAAMFAAANIYGSFTGIESLKIKETDRIAALQTELKKLNVAFDYSDRYDFYQLKGQFAPPMQAINTYNDHRMAMSFAPLSLLGQIEIENPEVVEKSYPGFWNELGKAGFSVKVS